MQAKRRDIDAISHPRRTGIRRDRAHEDYYDYYPTEKEKLALCFRKTYRSDYSPNENGGQTGRVYAY